MPRLLQIRFWFAALLLAGCASTTIDATWTSPEAAGRRIDQPVLVVGVAHDETVRRVYEDDMAGKLNALGIRATQSYRVVPGMLDADSGSQLLREALRAGARYLLSTAVIGQDVEALDYADPWVAPGFVGYRGWYGAYWGMAWPAYTQVRTYRVVIAQTALTRAESDRVEWIARTRTTAPGNVEKETRAFVDVILAAMAKDGLVAGTK